MEKNNFADSWFNFKPMVGGRITPGARKHKLFNEVRLVIGDFELPLQFKKIEATNMVKRTINDISVYVRICLLLSALRLMQCCKTDFRMIAALLNISG